VLAVTAAFSLTARWVFPGVGPPLPGGVVTVEDGRVTGVSPRGERTADIDIGNAALIPGLVNAHTHLDLTGMRGVVPPSADFTGWLRAVIAHRHSTPPGDTLADVRRGLDEAMRTGTTLVGDIAGGGASWEVLGGAPVWAVVYHELLGLTEGRAAQALAAAERWLAGPSSANCRRGLSPHAPYSVRVSLFAGAAQLARPGKLPLAVHLAESRDELELLHHRRGPFVGFLRDLGVWDPDGLADSPAAVMAVCDQRVPRVWVHGNYLAPSARITRGTTVVYCPRSHAAFGHPPHPFREFLRRGVRVALGTDSLASNPDLDLLAEARFLRRLAPDLPGDTLLRMATLSGAEALGFADVTGSLEPGNSADIVAVALPDDDGPDPYTLLWDGDGKVTAVWWRGARRG
jgi:cytosine/adenosine deaminase-related metal-dependent hydrolase